MDEPESLREGFSDNYHIVTLKATTATAIKRYGSRLQPVHCTKWTAYSLGHLNYCHNISVLHLLLQHANYIKHATLVATCLHCNQLNMT